MKLEKLKHGDEIRVIAPSSAWNPKRTKQYERALKKLENLGFKVSLGKYLKNAKHLDAVSSEDRVNDLHDAYKDKDVKAIMALNGGWLANSLLPLIDWDLIKSNPKPLIGYSDITILLNAIYAKTGNIGFLGPNLGTFGIKHGADFTAASLIQAICGDDSYKLKQSEKWGEGKKRKEYTTHPWTVLQSGSAEGILIGGNIATLYLLQGTEFYPSFNKDTILLIEDDDESKEYTALEFDRRLESLLQQPDARKFIKGVIIGRFQTTSKITLKTIDEIVASKKLMGIPVIADVDFGHTQPLLTLPIGGKAIVEASDSKAVIHITRGA